MTRDFEIVPPDEAPPPSATGPGHPSALSLALERGDVAFVTTSPRSINNRDAYLSRRGYRTSQQRGERNGVKGWYIRAVKRDAS